MTEVRGVGVGGAGRKVRLRQGEHLLTGQNGLGRGFEKHRGVPWSWRDRDPGEEF